MNKILALAYIVGTTCLLTGCELPSASLIYNLTRCPIAVTYSAANIHDNRVVLAPGQSAGAGPGAGPFLRVDKLAIKSQNSFINYSKADLEKRRPRLTIGDVWVFSDTGLHFRRSDPDKKQIETVSQKHCPGGYVPRNPELN